MKIGMADAAIKKLDLDIRRAGITPDEGKGTERLVRALCGKTSTYEQGAFSN
jgi:hypothetical protein